MFHNTTGWILVFLQLVLWVRLYSVGGVMTFSLSSIWIGFLGLVNLLLLSYGLGILCQRSKFVRSLAEAVLVMLFAYLGIYHFRYKNPVDYSVLTENFTLLGQSESWQILFSTLKPNENYLVLFLGVITAVASLSASLKWRNKAYKQKGTWVGWMCLGLSLAIGILPKYQMDGFSIFVGSIYEHYFPRPNPFAQPDDRGPYPEVRSLEFSAQNSNEDKTLRPVILLMVESFNARYANSLNPDTGEKYMPYFGELIEKGLYVENFYGPSVQTARGQFAILCGTLPSMKKKVFTDYPNLNLKCLPEILRQQGYATFFSQAMDDLSFDNTGPFLLKNGFDEAWTMDATRVSAEEKAQYWWGWGLQDDVFYQKTFSELDKAREKAIGMVSTQSALDKPILENPSPNKPVFLALMNLSNHMRFDQIPEPLKKIYKGNLSFRKNYINSIRLVDDFLRVFISEVKSREYLKNAIVVITGDHSFPTGEHFNTANENYAWQENFRTPLLILDMKGGESLPEVRNLSRGQKIFGPYSHIDIAPTVMDLLGISDKTHFIGHSIFGNKPQTIRLIQPYGGLYLAAIQWPYKYIWHQKTAEEYLFDLAADPDEQVNLIGAVGKRVDPEAFYRLKAEITFLYHHQTLIEQDRIWPKK